jgi:hypothetical protein
MERKKVQTPVGKLMWVTVTGQGRENLSGVLQYSADVHLSLDAAEAFCAEVDKFWEENKPNGYKEAKSLGYKEGDDDTIIISAKTGTTFPSGDPKSIAIYDAKGKRTELADGVSIGNGSIGRLACTMSIYKAGKAAGVTLYLDAVQVSHLVEYSGGGASFDKIDDGDFESDEPFAEIKVA